MTGLERLLGYLATALMWLCGLCVVGMMLHVFGDVLAKIIFGKPLPGTSEIVARYYMLGVVFLPLPLIELRNSSIVVDLFYHHFGPRFQRLCMVLGYAGQVAFFAMLAWRSYWDALRSFERGEFVDGQVQIIIWPATFFLPLGFSVAAMIGLLRLVQVLTRDDWARITEPRAEADTANNTREAI